MHYIDQKTKLAFAAVVVSGIQDSIWRWYCTYLGDYRAQLTIFSYLIPFFTFYSVFILKFMQRMSEKRVLKKIFH